MTDRFEDERGVIQDLLTEPIDSITRITTKQGAIRGNHVHKFTTQWTYVLFGNLWVCNGNRELLLGPGEICRHGPGEPHAWKATQDTDCLVFTRGPRAGENYEDDTIRLADPLIDSGHDWAAAEGMSRTDVRTVQGEFLVSPDQAREIASDRASYDQAVAGALATYDPLGGASRGVGRCTCPAGPGTNPACQVHP